MTTLQQFIDRHGIALALKPGKPSAAFKDGHHYRAILTCGARRMTVPFHTGSGWDRQPSVADVLDCLASDASGYVNAGSFADWASEYGYDTDSRTALATFRTIAKQSTRLALLLGSEQDYQTLLFDTERL